MNRFPRLEILPAAQRRLWPSLVGVRQFGFVLYGGTAVALRLGHRQSIDFDFFSDASIAPDQPLAALPWLASATILQQTPNALTALVASDAAHVKVSLFSGLRFGRVGTPTLTPDGVLEVASLPDLLGHKLKVLLQRVEAKDYLDIDAIIAAGHELSAGLASAKALFPNFPEQEALKALTYFEGGDLHDLPQAVCARLVKAAGSVTNIPSASVLSATLSGGGTTPAEIRESRPTQ